LFYSRPFLKVERKEAILSDPEEKFLIVEDNLSFMDTVCLILASKGYCGGNPETISKMPVNWVLKMKDFDRFCMTIK